MTFNKLQNDSSPLSVMKEVILAGIFLSLFSPIGIICAPQQGTSSLPSFQGRQATVWNGAAWFGSCEFGTWKSSLPYTAVAHANYGNSVLCGSCVKVTNPTVGKPVYGIITNECADCPPGALDMSPQFYNAVMGKPNGPGRTTVNWEVVDCKQAQAGGRDFKVSIVPKKGSSSSWFEFQVAGTTLPIKSVQVKTKAGSWVTTTRTNYNYFAVPPSAKGDLFDIQITCSNGAVLSQPGVAPSFGKNVPVAKNCT